MGNYDFSKDLEQAQVVEKEALEKIKLRFPGIADLVIKSIAEWDIKGQLNGEPITFEVKNELKVTETGNVAIEFQCRGKNSGIDITQAIHWVEKIRGEFFIIQTEELRKRISRGEYDIIKIGGDAGSNTKFYLVKEEKFKSWCEKM